MPVKFQQIKKPKTSNEERRNTNRAHRKTFVYSKRNSDLNFQQMYCQLKQNVTQLVQQNRLKLISMNSIRSKDLVNRTQNKLISYLRSKSGKNKLFNNSSTQRKHKSNIYFNNIDSNCKQNQQQIFDFNKLQKIIKMYDKEKNCQTNNICGALAEKFIKITQKNMLKRPLSHRNLNFTAQSTQTSKNYLGWAAQKTKRRLKHMFS